ncbi:hypothetical protein F0U44_19150 [Nocardioides humilatus]|uniref:Secreted protein n=1 Tax=Nocardioides humilatus TaxID=2607660 RepID=A0A5B1L6U2_9ACTN|nr:hypothetical protein [Nocardioides humilatus]KAA1416431.1 hypothetical protein F0U44_19150 [Nocardioides humilatus]
MKKALVAAIAVLATVAAASPTTATTQSTRGPDSRGGRLGEPAMSSQTIVRKCDRVITTTVVTDRDGDVLKRTREVRFRDRRC